MDVRDNSETVSHRRKLLGATGSALLASVAGCASIVEQSSDGAETTEESTTTGTTVRGTTARNRSNGDELAANASDANVSNANASGANASGANVSDAGDKSDSAEEKLGRIPIEKPDVSVPSALVPDDPGQYDYARLGRADADATATLYGNWKCPYTQEFVVQMMDSVVEEFVASGDVAVEFRALSHLDGEPFLGPDAPRAARAGLAVWQSSPERYWQYFASVFANQPPEKYEWATADRLVRFARAANVGDVDAVQRAMLTGKHREKVRATTDRAVSRGVVTVPRIATENSVTAPTVNPKATARQLRRAAER